MTQPPPPGYPPQQPPPAGQAPNNNLVIAILSTVFCCLPLGIVAIVKATQVSGLWAQGQYAEAQAAADSAKKFSLWSLIAGVVVYVVAIIINVVAASSVDTSTAAMLTSLVF
jgi:hypothetical protein